MHPTTFLSLAVTLLSYVSAYTLLSDASLARLPSPGKDFDIHNGALLAPILRVRIPGTPEIEEVRQHFVTFFQTFLPEWTISFQNSTQDTALGKRLPFVNIIATRDPPWARVGDIGRLSLVAHYDSKLEPQGFIGAVDSAAPCAMLMHTARSVDRALTEKWEAMQKKGEVNLSEEKGLQILLLDGEEAFIDWSETDSLYGARSLAAEWDSTLNPAMSTFRSNISSITLFVLLDLLGSARPNVPSYFPTTHWAYQAMAKVELRLRALRQLKSSPNHASKRPSSSRPNREPIFLSEADKDPGSPFFGGAIEDDHVPFMQRGVEVLHIIPNPFPSVWHTSNDDGPHLDIDTVEDWAHIVTAFTAEWMDLEGYMPVPGNPGGSHPSRSEGFLEERGGGDDVALQERDEL